MNGMSAEEANTQLEQLKDFLRVAQAMLQSLDLAALRTEAERFESFAPLFDPTLWMKQRDVNRDLLDWLIVMTPLKARLDALTNITEEAA